MSKDKNKAEYRAGMLLAAYVSRGSRAIMLNHEGGQGMFDKNIQWLLKRGYLKLKPGRSNVPKWSKQFKRMFGPGTHIHGKAFRTFAQITEEGVAFAEKSFEEYKKNYRIPLNHYDRRKFDFYYLEYEKYPSFRSKMY